MIYAKIKSTGSYLPKKVLTNSEICEHLDTSDGVDTTTRWN